MDWIQALTIVTFLFLLQRIERNLNYIKNRIDKIEYRMDIHSNRIDNLYMMFVDLLKDKK